MQNILIHRLIKLSNFKGKICQNKQTLTNSFAKHTNLPINNFYYFIKLFIHFHTQLKTELKGHEYGMVYIVILKLSSIFVMS